MNARQQVNEPLVSGGVRLPAGAPGSRTPAGSAPAGATPSPVRDCLFCRYRRSGGTPGDQSHP
jgi:hypothetical protein